MAIDAPLYEPGDAVYLKESAALGFLEAVTISGVVWSGNKWMYTIRVGPAKPMSGRYYGDRITTTNAQTLYYTEDEFVTECDALALAEENAERILQRLQKQRASICPSTE